MGPIDNRNDVSRRRKRLQVVEASGQGVPDGAANIPSELLEDGKFVKINNDDPHFGPPALLLLGFRDFEVPKIQEMLKNMGGDFLQVLVCTSEMAKGTLGTAMSVSQPDPRRIKPGKGLPRICFLSGLTGEELLTVIDAFSETGLEPTVFAAMVPNNFDKDIGQLTEEIMGDHERATRQQAAQA